MTTSMCSKCGAEAHTLRGSYEFKESGLRNVILQGIEVIRCDKCGNEDPIIPRVNDLMRVLALAVIAKPYRLTGTEIRFVRKYLEMTGEQLSRLLHVDNTTLSKWENNDDPVGEQSDLLIRSVALALGEGLQDKLEKIVREFAAIQQKRRRRPVRIEVNSETLQYQYA